MSSTHWMATEELSSSSCTGYHWQKPAHVLLTVTAHSSSAFASEQRSRLCLLSIVVGLDSGLYPAGQSS